MIPDSIMDILIAKLNVEDFRMTPDDLIKKINTLLPDNSTEEDFKKIALEELNRFKDPKRRGMMTWALVDDLLNPSSVNSAPKVVKLLCKQIDDQSPYYPQAQKILAEMSLMKVSAGTTIEEKYKKPLIKMLEAGIPEVHLVAKAFVCNNHVDESLPPALENILDNLTDSTETIYLLLNYIRELRNPDNTNTTTTTTSSTSGNDIFGKK